MYLIAFFLTRYLIEYLTERSLEFYLHPKNSTKSSQANWGRSGTIIVFYAEASCMKKYDRPFKYNLSQLQDYKYC